MLLNNITMVNTHTPVTIDVRQDKIAGLRSYDKKIDGGAGLDFTNAIAFPGIINSHDHLDFNCFSPLGHQTYRSYTAWGHHIHQTYKEDINAVLKIPPALRIAWGIYKNLLAGVTTVINHGDLLKIDNPLIAVYQDVQNLHSVKFQKNWKWKLNNPFLKNKTCVMHTGEGVDDESAGEIDELLQWNLLHRKLVGVHAVAMNERQARRFAAIVWCPQSNKLLLNQHAAVNQLKQHTRLVFGTDATLTGHWNIWHHLRLARQLQLVSDEELFEMITNSAAALWQTNSGELLPGKDADIVIATTTNGKAGWNDFFSVDPTDILLVIQKGAIRLFDEKLLPQLNNGIVNVKNFSPVVVNSAVKYAEGNLPGLIKAIRTYYPDAAIPAGIEETPILMP